jgi:hypothetical protein
LINRAARSPEWTVLDLDRFRRRLSPTLRKLPVPYPLFVLAVVLAIAGKPQVVVESRGTYAWMRRLITNCARIRGRHAVIVLLDASPEEAVAGQVHRGRVAPSGVMRLNTTGWTRLRDAANSGRLSAEGWSQVVVLNRTQASTVQDLGELLRGPSQADGSDEAQDDRVRLPSSTSRRRAHQ